MNTNGTNPGMNVDDYENMAVQKSNTAKRVAAGAALLVGGAAVGGGAAYAASEHTAPNLDEEVLTSDDVVDGANAGESFQDSNESHPDTVTERVVYVEKPAEQVEEEKEPTVTWDEKTVVYDDEGKVVGSMESGTVNGKNFALVDLDGDDHADYLAIDMDGNNRFDDNEVVKYDVSDHVHMGHETAHTKEIHYNSPIGETPTEDPHYVAYHDEDHSIHNNFEDEKTGESYHDDFAENNPDYNPNADTNHYDEGNNYLAENDSYDADNDSYSADIHEEYLAEADDYDNSSTEHDMADTDFETADEPLESSADYTAEAEPTDSYDDMIGEEEFLG